LEKKIKEASKPKPQPLTTTKIDIDAANSGELTESERAEAATKIQKHFENFLSGIITEPETPPHEERLGDPSITGKRNQEDISPNPVVQTSYIENERESEPSILKIQNKIEQFKDKSEWKDRNLHRIPSRRRFGTPSRNRFDDYSNRPGVLRTHRSPTYHRNRWSDYDISESENRFSRQPFGGRRFPGLSRASNPYWYNEDHEDYRRNTYSTVDRHSKDFSSNYRNLPYRYPSIQKENSDTRDQTVNGNEARQPKYDYIERPQRREPNEVKYSELAKEITSFTVLNRMAYNLLASSNFSIPSPKTRNSTEFKFTMAIIDGTLEYLESELKEVEEMSDYDTFNFYKSVPDRLSQLTDMTKRAQALSSDSAEPLEYIKNQQLEGIFVMMDDVVKEIGKMTETLSMDYDDDEASRLERLMLLDEYSRDYGECENRWTVADEIAFLKRKLDQCMKLCSQCS
uniref:DUF4378 domain-containing protein n=1 Tax=Rodentolepis nana TaxID=102285 RepID=A0A0R3TBU5_RODNA